jgi:hypothetical protein
MKSAMIIAMVVLASLATQCVSATAITIQNGGFEAADLYPAAQRVANWVADSDAYAAPVAPPLSGLQGLQLWGYTGIMQDTGVQVLAGQTYTFTVNERKFTSDPYGSNYIQMWAGNPFGGGGTEIGTDFSFGNLTDTYQSFTVSGVATAAQAGKNFFVRIRHEGGFVMVDDVSATVTPEPATMILLGLGGLLLRRRA